MTWNERVRTTHRWFAIVFTVGVVVNMVALGQVDPAHPEAPPMWVGLSALIPLALLEFSGLYLFVLPYAIRWRSGRSTA